MQSTEEMMESDDALKVQAFISFNRVDATALIV